MVNIGIGGSDLGPVMAYEALRHYSDRAIDVRFVSNVDGTDFAETIRDLDPAETLFIVCSKTFTTLETMTNARTARDWLVTGLGDEEAVVDTSSPSRRTPKTSRTSASTLAHVRLLGLGRRSLLDELRDRPVDDDRHRVPTASGRCSSGFHAMDEHFRTAPFERNLPGADGPAARVWYANFFDAQTVAVLPYDQYLARFPPTSNS